MSQPSQDNIDKSQTAQPGGSNAKASAHIDGNIIIGIVAILVVAIAIGIAVRAEGKADLAVEEARKMERETRIMQDDLKFIRSYLSAKGIDIPANHEEAEEKPH